MRIIYLCKGDARSAGMRHFGYDLRFFNGLVRNGHAVHMFATSEKARALSVLGMRSIGRKRTNKQFIDFVSHVEPDAIVFSHTGVIALETFQELRAKFPAMKIANLNVDALFSKPNRDSLMKWRVVTDATFITTGGAILEQLSAPHSPFYFIPNVTDNSIDTGRAFEQSETLYDLCCVMHGGHNVNEDQQRRIAIATSVAAAVPGLKTCYRGFNGAPAAYGAELAKLHGDSAMALNLNRDSVDGIKSDMSERHMYSSDRIAHVMGNGCLTFLQDGFGLQRLYADDEAVFFKDAGDLADKVAYYKNNHAARRQIAENGWKKAHRDYNETVVMRFVIEKLFGLTSQQIYNWPQS